MRVLLILISIVLTSCASTTMVKPESTLSIETIPPIGQIETQELGNSLMSRIYKYVMPTYRLTNKVYFRYIDQYLEPQILRPDVKFKGSNTYCGKGDIGELCIAETDGVFKDIRTKYALSLPYNDFPSEYFVADTYIDFNYPNNTAELIYNGREGNVVKFIYREYASTNQGSMIRDSFTQNISYDLSEGNIIGFKGARIEILDAANSELKYKALAFFSN